MSQPPVGNYPAQPQPQPQPQSQPRPPRPRRKPLRKRSVVLLLVGAVALIAIIASVTSGGKAPSKQLSAAGKAASLAAALRSAERACAARPPASRPIYVRIIKPGASPQARRLSGRWRWDHVTGQCLTAVRFMTATAPRGRGHCTQVGYVTANRGYNPHAQPARPLRHVAAHAGPACAAAASSSPAAAPSPTTPAPSPTTPAPPPATTAPAEATSPMQSAPPTTAPPPAPTTQASCYPVSDGGNCYEPGEYCRAGDHGMTGVAGDGEAIVCEDNNGWRWEPA